MHLSPLPDAAIWPMFIAFGGIVLCGVFPAVILVEALVLRLLKWETAWQVLLLDAVVINISSGLMGLLIPFSIGTISGSEAGLVVGFIAAWLFSIGIEGWLLLQMAKNRHQKLLSANQPWIGAAVANTVSYVMLGLVILIFVLFDL